jgi:demethylmenaquinone methyltransferase / 2-methoxy-6-polyprenyl-1,4-benzoquinol methylase
MFDAVAPRYDLLNDVLSLGMNRWWRREVVRRGRFRPGDRVLDLGCGTGKLAALLADRCRVVGVDVSREMLRLARGRTVPIGLLVQCSAFHLPFRDQAFDAAMSGFVLRNLEDLGATFDELARVVRPGGSIALVDLTEPRHRLLRRVFDGYFRTAAPMVGALAGRAAPYRYLVASLAQLPAPEAVAAMLASSGFSDVSVRPLTGGIATLFTATRTSMLARSPDVPHNPPDNATGGGMP